MEKWEVIRIHCDFLPNPHDKFCICICPENRWFLFINSDPPPFRKARELAVCIENFEATYLNHTSYVDTTKLIDIDQELVDQALKDPDRNHGALAPNLRTRIVEAASAHEVLPEEQRQKIIDD